MISFLAMLLAGVLVGVYLVIIVIAAIIAPPSPRVRRRSGYHRKPKGMFTALLEGQRRTERKNGSHRGVMCGPGGVGARGGKPRR